MKEDIVIRVKHNQITTRAGFNPRRDMGDMAALKASILQHGVQDAIAVTEVKEGEYLLGAQGHRRLKAIDELLSEGYKFDSTVPVKAEPKGLTDDTRTMQIITLNTGKPLTFLEQARVYGMLIPATMEAADRKKKVKEVSEATGVSQTAVCNGLILLSAPASLLRLIDSGKVSSTLALELYIEANACRGDWEKVEAAIIKGLEEAGKQGKGRVSRKNLKEDKEDDSEDDAKEAQKARVKELLGLERRLLVAGTWVKEVDKESKKSPALGRALADTLFTLLSSIIGTAHAGALGKDEFNLSDAKSNFKRVQQEIHNIVKAAEQKPAKIKK